MMLNSDNEYVVLDKELLEQCFKDLAKSLRKSNKTKELNCELVVVGGASILLNYGFRDTTSDVDCTDEHRILMNDVINNIALKHGLPNTWINTDFTNSKSYSSKLFQHADYYRSYSNGALIVRTIKDEYLLAMKVVSGRKYKNDYSDIYGIITFMNKDERIITNEKLDKAIVELYGSLEYADKEALGFARLIIDNPESVPYDEIIKMEKENANLLKVKKADAKDKADIEYILSKLEIM
jgi:hypothetical protein